MYWQINHFLEGFRVLKVPEGPLESNLFPRFFAKSIPADLIDS
jgi:hypothetical protein